jgi:hypothetical protein
MYLARNNQLLLFVISEYDNHNADNIEKLSVSIWSNSALKNVNTNYLCVIVTGNTFRHVPKIAKTYSFLRHVCLSVRSAWNNSAPNRRIFIKFDISVFSEICPENSSLIKIGQE